MTGEWLHIACPICLDGMCDNLHEGKVYMVTLPSLRGQIFTNIKHTHGRVAEVLTTDDASFMLGESLAIFKLFSVCSFWKHIGKNRE